MSTKRTIHNPMASFLQLLFLTVSIHTISITALSSTNNTGICSSNNTIFDPSTHKLVSQCSDHTFCSAPINGMCIPRLCRRDEFPFGYGPSEAPPPLCPQGFFCPDDGSGCLPLVSVGAPCEPNRDEQCSPPLDWQDLASFQNYNGSICLKSTCMYANITLGQSCIVDNTTYTDTGPNGEQYMFTVTRDNCRSPQFYCDPGSSACQRAKAVGVACQLDSECEERNCNSAKVCVEPPETPLRVAPWQWGLTIGSILAAMVVICILLTLIHRRHRYARYKELQEYYHDQIGLRRSIITLHTAAADRYHNE